MCKAEVCTAAQTPPSSQPKTCSDSHVYTTKPTSPRSVDCVEVVVPENGSAAGQHLLAFAQWNPFTQSYERQYWNAEEGRYESEHTQKQRAHFKRAFENHVRRQVEARVVDAYLGLERQKTQKEYVIAKQASLQKRKLTFVRNVCDACQELGVACSTCAYPLVLRSPEKFAQLQEYRKERVKRRFDQFAAGGDEVQQQKRMRQVWKNQTELPQAKRTTNLFTIFELSQC
jgi:hypothetical protein